MAQAASTAVAGAARPGVAGRRRATGWALWVLYLSVLVTTLVVQARTGWLFGALFSVGEALVLVLFATTGLLILRRQHTNRIAWIFLWMPLGVTIERASGAYVLAAVPGQPEGLLELVAVWCAGSYVPSGLSILLLFAHLPLLYPDGRTLSRRWQLLLWALTLLWLAQTIGFATRPGPFEEPFHRFSNPIGWEPGGILAAVLTVGGATLPLMLLAGVASLVVRWRGSSGVERQQLKWFLYAVSLLFLVMLANTVAPLLLDATTDDTIGGLLFLVGIGVLPLALGVAVLRHRLYEIDRIISRTVSYVAVAAVLAGVYVAGILTLSSVARAVTGESGDMVVALSTLLVAALFQPLRRRVQAVVDRRFNRRHHDAEAVLEEFARSLRDELDTTTLTSSLHAAATTGLQPATVSVSLLPRSVSPR